MASNNKCGLTQGERERFLREHGFERSRSGKGSHETWEHPELKELAKSHDIAPPANLLANPAQKIWECTLCDNPASGTWHSMVKFAEWCAKAVTQIKSGAVENQQRQEILKQFREAVDDTCQWKKDVKNWLKAGLKASKAPQPPVSYQELQDLKSKKNQLSKPTA